MSKPGSGGDLTRFGPVLVLAAAFIVCFAAVGSMAWKASLPYKGYAEPSVTLVIEAGKPARAAALQLQQARVVRSALAFRILMRLRRAEEKVHAGEYEFTGPMRPDEVLDKLVRGDVVLHKITVPEGLRMDETADLISAAGYGNRASWIEAIHEAKLISDLDPDATDLEGYLFPETYLLPRGATPDSIVAEMVQRFRREMTPLRRSRMQELGLNIRQAVTLASLVEEEAKEDEERPRIAGVFLNRLSSSMLLQCDPTVVYALVRDNQYRGRIYRTDLDYASPYNTYIHPGLPPGPISSPGLRSLDAALNPARTGELYFVVSGPGRHRFSTTLEQHELAVRRYRQGLDLANRHR
jgi:UPF0755 protein